jgi:TfoX/Sxy family transcriptional regulator of competence genes
MKLEKSPPELEQAFAAAFPDDPRAESRKMFGFSAGFVNGNMFGGLFERDMVVRLSDADRATLSSEHGARPFEPMGRPMTGYLRVPSSILDDSAQVRHWLQRGFDYAASLPPKERRAAKPKAKKTAR